MQKIDTQIEGCVKIKPLVSRDQRGTFVKHYQKEIFLNLKIDLNITESYYSLSKRHVLRGLHFQRPPFEHHKLVTCIQGHVIDVTIDLRIGSPSYGRCAQVTLDESDQSSIYVPAGVAHGFYVTSDTAILLYNVSSSHHPDSDSGIAWNSIPLRWPIDSEPIISERDSRFIRFEDFSSPFHFEANK
jgi:dTDP-4-dehydrorhamnose 3,5-epimerase